MAKGFKGPGMGRPEKELDFNQLKSLMRLKPTLSDTAAFFECSERKIERFIRKHADLTFVEFREQHMVHTRLGLVRKMIEKAMSGDNYMLIWCSKNMLGWSDKYEDKGDIKNKITINIDGQDQKL